VNLIDRQVEVYTDTCGGKNPTYREQTSYGPGDAVPVVVGGQALGTVSIDHLLP
jgi:hypothetical protein